uniref:Ig-like domain-containing protein n=1 Tax=Knipowitschia caucasica TaxID=637954 RepID=A0AAV2MF11_KNICA
MERWLLVTVLLSSASGAVGEDGWDLVVPAEVRGREGYPMVLPCSFSHPLHSHHASLQVSWRRGHSPDSVLVFHCVSHSEGEGCEAGLHQDQRYRLEGNPREHDLSLRISSTTLQDSGRYYCQLDTQGKQHRERGGTRVRIEAPPRIMSLTLESGPSDCSFGAVCRVQGSPLPDVQWLEPEGVSAVTQTPEHQEEPHSHAKSRLAPVRPRTHYTCTATNPLGRDQATLYYLQPPPCTRVGSGTRWRGGLVLLLVLSLGSKATLVIGLGLWMLRRGRLQNPHCLSLKHRDRH